eukprot:CAMPEP_0119372128 /NCGR_PEP_ID=MMETSP1334-20130426/18163_1 /TAXON_ID=127549 /ORGANISM="Calcidiscus leptoporus, Strain RCC1130" /LENGTH=109 /DNA_ID=CAMNT_0007389537 /DNA_START=161 /DNA_END=489 /DNA_ORIENTATION=-
MCALEMGGVERNGDLEGNGGLDEGLEGSDLLLTHSKGHAALALQHGSACEPHELVSDLICAVAARSATTHQHWRRLRLMNVGAGSCMFAGATPWIQAWDLGIMRASRHE